MALVQGRSAGGGRNRAANTLPSAGAASPEGWGWSTDADSLFTAHAASDSSTHSKFREGRENTGKRRNLKKKVPCHSRNSQSKEHTSNQIVLIPTCPHTFPHYLKQSPYGLESKVHGRQGLSEFSAGRLSSKKFHLQPRGFLPPFPAVETPKGRSGGSGPEGRPVR